ncbi:MAG: radical SAM protein [Proteobacteria bacterium]|nr:radical SAM protein [Pseudomonadota bacterium]
MHRTDGKKSKVEKESARSILRIADCRPDTLSEGPYRRFALWMQGCTLKCPGCCNPEMQETEGGSEIPMEKMLESILAVPDIEGLTLLGGEPFEQCRPLSWLAREVQRAGLGVIAFSGYTLEALSKSGKDVRSLLKATDVLIDGPYVGKHRIHWKRWIGSSNQKIHYLTSRYRNCTEFDRPGQSIHISFSGDELTITGFPDLFPESTKTGSNRSKRDPTTDKTQ